MRAKYTKSSKKCKKFGILSDTAKKLRVSTYDTGPDCQCKKYECFKNINDAERTYLINQFSDIGCECGTNAQNSYLSGIISLQPVAQQKSRKNDELARLNKSLYSYKVRVIRNGSAVEWKCQFVLKGFWQFLALSILSYIP